MRVIVNQSTALGARSGIGQYTVALVDALRATAPMDDIDVFPPAWCGALRRRVTALRSPRESRGEKRSWRDSLLRPLRTIAEGATGGYLALATRWHKYELYHEPNYIPLPSSLPTVATVHDLSVLLHPEWHPRDRVIFYERHFADGLKRCGHLLAVSEFTRREMMRELNVPAERITCTLNGVRPDLHPLTPAQLAAGRRRLGLPERYLLFVGTIEPRKNPLLMMRAYGDLPAPVRERCPLVLAGSWGWNAGPFFEHYQNEGRHRGIIHLGYVADDDLRLLYGAARALVFPTLYEGFGLPPLEMMACGGAVLASTADTVAEVVGERAHLLASEDFAGWRDAMQRVIIDDDWHSALRVGVCEHARSFTWERCARQTLGVYRSMLGQAALPETSQPLRRAG
jgi:alpha-1,3-rhamnosyl/mannosyltransferase